MDCPFSTMYNYLGEDGHCSRCPAYQDCNNAVSPHEDEDEEEEDKGEEEDEGEEEEEVDDYE